MSQYNPETFLVNRVVVNGKEYIGSYKLINTIRVKDNAELEKVLADTSISSKGCKGYFNEDDCSFECRGKCSGEECGIDMKKDEMSCSCG